jgi:hypothetical protein
LLEKYTELDSILKFENRSNGFSPSGSNQVHVSGGLMNFLIVMLNSQSRSNYTSEEVLINEFLDVRAFDKDIELKSGAIGGIIFGVAL